MKRYRLASAAAVALMLAAMPVLLSASDDALPSKDGGAVQKPTDEKGSTTQFATLKGVKAVPMGAKELNAVKGLHVHFLNGSNNIVDTPFGSFEGLHLAGDVKTQNNWSDLYGQGDVARSYRGLCKAAVNGSAIFIESGGGCGY